MTLNELLDSMTTDSQRFSANAYWPQNHNADYLHFDCIVNRDGLKKAMKFQVSREMLESADIKMVQSVLQDQIDAAIAEAVA